ncbi:MAG: hypothetical protein ACTSWA_06560, partial [Candidatus Thorarchaeota archaeon]
LENLVPITLTISVIVHLGKRHNMDFEAIWTTPQFRSLNRREQWLLKNERFYPYHVLKEELPEGVPIRRR